MPPGSVLEGFIVAAIGIAFIMAIIGGYLLFF
jgi:hypothetical protein